MSDCKIKLKVNGDSPIALNVKEEFAGGGGGITPTGTKTINISANGTTTEDVTTYATAQVVANVPNSYAASDEGKVVDNGALVTQGSAEYTANGTYNTTMVSSVEVNVPGSSPSGTKQISITQNGTTTENVAAYASAEITANVPNSYTAGDEGKVVDDGALVSQTSATYTTNDTYDTTLINSVTVNVSGGGSPNLQTKTETYTPSESAQTDQITADAGYDGLEEVDITINAISSTYVGSGIDRRDGDDLTASGDTVSVPAGYYAASASKAVAAGTAGTPSATKGAVSNHSIDVTPSVTNSAGYIASETKTGTAVTVTAAELESGTKSITANGTGIDVTGFSAVDVNVSGGGTTEPEPLDVDLIDYDGTLLYTYSKADFLALDSLPANPSHSGLVAQGWNWTLADAKTYVTAHGVLVIGQSYKTDDNKSRIYISIPEGSYPVFGIVFFVENGYNATLAWGDGNSETVAGQAAYLNKSHTYNSAGDYVITIACEGKLQFGCDSTNFTIYGGGAADTYRQPYLKKIEFSNNVVRIRKNAFNGAVALESISIPTSLTNMRDDSGASTFAGCYNLKGLVIPSGCEFMYNSAFTYCPMKYISFSKMTFAIGASISQFIDYCWNLRKLTLPDGISSAYDIGIVNHTMAMVKCVAMCAFTSAGQNYFRNSPALSRLDIPSSITAIAANAFNGNRGLREIHFYATTPPTLANSNAIGNLCTGGFTIYVPYSADHSVLNAYKTATNWSTHASRMEEESA